MNKSLRYIRITVEVICALLLTALLVDCAAGTAVIAGWLARLQFIPASLSMSFAIVAFWLGFTLIFGRIYCSTICPLGALQDLIARMPSLSRHKKPQRLRRQYTAPQTALRSASLFIFAAALMGVPFILSYIDPYTAYSRMAVYLLKPVYGSAENLIAELGEFYGLWTLAFVNIGVISITGIIISAVTLTVIAATTLRHGRWFCNTLCPAGAALGIVSRYSIFHMDIDTDKCIQCHKCVQICKAECILMPDHVVDLSRCVVCFDCTDVCPNGAITYTTRRKKLATPMMMRISTLWRRQGEISASGIDSASGAGTAARPQSSPRLMDRRKFIATGIVAAAAPLMAMAERDTERSAAKPLTAGSVPLVPSRYVTPPGAKSRADFLSSCTGCGLCISNCTSHVLRPATQQYGFRHVMVPFMDFTQSWCYYNCVKCTTLCPTNAIHSLTHSEKHRFLNGLARIEASNCISAADGIPCGACARRCPVNAITMQPVNDRTPNLMPVVNPDTCIGCGACEYICPASPYKAIVINGNH